MVVTTTEGVAGRHVERAIGQVFGVAVRSRGLGGNLAAQFKSLWGGEIHQYRRMLNDARRQAVDRMVENAHAMGADAVVMMRFDSSAMGPTIAQVVAYGTAVALTSESS